MIKNVKYYFHVFRFDSFRKPLARCHSENQPAFSCQTNVIGSEVSCSSIVHHSFVKYRTLSLSWSANNVPTRTLSKQSSQSSILCFYSESKRGNPPTRLEMSLIPVVSLPIIVTNQPNGNYSVLILFSWFFRLEKTLLISVICR